MTTAAAIESSSALAWFHALSDETRLGIVAKLAFPTLPRKWSVAGYLALGWIAVVALVPMIASVPRAALWLIAAGGLVYSFGVPVYVSKSLRFRRAIWHSFVIAAAALHWAAVLIVVVAPRPA